MNIYMCSCHAAPVWALSYSSALFSLLHMFSCCVQLPELLHQHVCVRSCTHSTLISFRSELIFPQGQVTRKGEKTQRSGIFTLNMQHAWLWSPSTCVSEEKTPTCEWEHEDDCVSFSGPERLILVLILCSSSSSSITVRRGKMCEAKVEV